MNDALTTTAMLADALGGWEIILILAVILLLFGAKNLPNLARGLNEFDQSANDAGKSLGGIYGKPAAEALTPDNQVAELYDPELRDKPKSRRASNTAKLIVFIAQGFGAGRIPFAPGTWGSLLGIAWVALLLASHNYWIYLACALVGIPVAVWTCGEAERILGDQDPPSVVLDEIVALPICFAVIVTILKNAERSGIKMMEELLRGVPREHVMISSGPDIDYLRAIFCGDLWWLPWVIFALFRLFDIWKPWPIRQSQSLPKGWGVVVDDLLAAVYVNVVVLAALFALAR